MNDLQQVYTRQGYKPIKRNRIIADAAWKHVSSVPYKVSARWLFYRLLDDGHYKGKDDYETKFKSFFSTLRHNNYKLWRPDTLSDEGRTPVTRSGGHTSPSRWSSYLIDAGVACDLDPYAYQPNYIVICYEANAMTAQFDHYTAGIDLYPFGGDPSIPYKMADCKSP